MNQETKAETKPAKVAKPAKEKKEAPVKAEKIAQPKQNGISRPKDGTATGKIWAIADSLSTEAGAPINRKPVIEACEKEKLNKATVVTQYSRWRKFHGLVGTGVEKAEKAVVEPATTTKPVAATIEPAVG